VQILPNILVLGTADWDQPIATNQHYITRELARGGFELTFVESLALRRPTLSARDLKRVARRLARAFKSSEARAANPVRELPSGVEKLSPLVIPVHKGLPARVNRYLLRRSVRRWISSLGPKVLWCYTPTTYGLDLLADVTVYHCVDLLGDVPGIDPEVIESNERRLAAAGSIGVATSAIVRDSLKSRGFEHPALWENVADTQVFKAAASEGLERKRGRVVFAGNLSPSKVDYSILVELARAGLEVRVAGPRAEGGGDDEVHFARLLEAGVRYLGMLAPGELARELATATVGLVPYVINPYTRGVSPLKTYEYLSAGVAVVATALPGVHPDEEDVFTEDSLDSFIARVHCLAEIPTTEDLTRRFAKADRHSWDGRGRQARELLSGLIDGKSERA